MWVSLIDCDEVLANFNEALINIIKTQFGIEVVFDDINRDIFEYPNIKPIKEDIWEYICKTPNIVRSLNKFPYTDELLSKLRKVSDKVICVTAIMKSRYYPGERFEWLIEEAGFDRRDIILCTDKQYVYGDVLIDDRPSKLIPWHDRWNKDPVLWQSHNWPRDSREPEIPFIMFKTGNVDNLIRYIEWMKM